MFVVRGLLRGTIAQVFAFSGVLLGVLAGSNVADWVGGHWRGARPEFVFLFLRWVVACLVGFGVAALGIPSAFSGPPTLTAEWFLRSFGGAIAGGIVLGWGAALLGLGALVGMVSDLTRNSFH